MKAPGFDRPLYLLPFDHRGSFQTEMFGWRGPLSPTQIAEITATKQVIYEGFNTALAAGSPKSKAGILVDEQFGSAILRDGAARGYMTAAPAEKSGEKEFEFEYGEDYAKHIETFRPTFCKVLVRYNVEADSALNRRQLQRRRQLSDYLHSSAGRSLFMVELLVPPEKVQLDRVGGDKEIYEFQIRPSLMSRAIQQ